MPSDNHRRGVGGSGPEETSALAVIRAQHTAGGGGVYLGRVGDRWVWSGAEHAALVLGPPRSGKTTAVVVPSVLAAPGAVVCTSTKPDIARVTAGSRRRSGPCLMYDPSGTVAPIPGVEALKWSPVTACRKWDGALLMAYSMVDTARRVGGSGDSGPHWSERAGALLGPLLHAAAIEGLGMDTVVRWVDRHQAGPAVTALDDVGAAAAADLLAGIVATDVREQSGIWSTASGVLRAYRSDAAMATTVGPGAEADALVEAGATVYVCAPGRHQAALAPLVVGLLADVRTAVYGRAAAWEAAGGRHPDGGGAPSPVLFALDEVANIAPIPDLPGMVSEAGGQGLTVLACLQDLSQARRRWGPDADGLLSLFGTTVVLPGIGDVPTLQALSVLGGEMEVVQRSISAPVPSNRPLWRAAAERLLLGPGANPGPRRPPSATYSTTRRRRLPAEAIAHGRGGDALLLDQRNRTHWLTPTPWYTTDPWRRALAPALEPQQDPRTGSVPRQPDRDPGHAGHRPDTGLDLGPGR